MWQAACWQHYICYVSAGAVAITFGDGYAVELEEVVVRKGCVWEVCRGNSFQLGNASGSRSAAFVFPKVSSPRVA